MESPEWLPGSILLRIQGGISGGQERVQYRGLPPSRNMQIHSPIEVLEGPGPRDEVDAPGAAMENTTRLARRGVRRKH